MTYPRLALDRDTVAEFHRTLEPIPIALPHLNPSAKRSWLIARTLSAMKALADAYPASLPYSALRAVQPAWHRATPEGLTTIMLGIDDALFQVHDLREVCGAMGDDLEAALALVLGERVALKLRPRSLLALPPHRRDALPFDAVQAKHRLGMESESAEFPDLALLIAAGVAVGVRSVRHALLEDVPGAELLLDAVARVAPDLWQSESHPPIHVLTLRPETQAPVYAFGAPDLLVVHELDWHLGDTARASSLLSLAIDTLAKGGSLIASSCSADRCATQHALYELASSAFAGVHFNSMVTPSSDS